MGGGKHAHVPSFSSESKRMCGSVLVLWGLLNVCENLVFIALQDKAQSVCFAGTLSARQPMSRVGLLAKLRSTACASSVEYL